MSSGWDSWFPSSRSASGAVPTSLVLEGVRRMEPGTGIRVLKRRTVVAARILRARPWLSAWLEADAQASLRREIGRKPELLGFVVWPYVHSQWEASARFEAMAMHLRTVEERFPALALEPASVLPVLSLCAVSPGLRLEIDRAGWFLREGWLVFNLFEGEHRLMSLAFSLASVGQEVIAYVGAIQGSNRVDAMQVYRNLTRALHGLRPRDFLVKSFQLFLGALGVDAAMCISDRFRQHRHPYFGETPSSRLHLDYDEIWRENGALALPSGFYRLAPSPAMRPLGEVPVRKRAMYRRRHDLLHALDAELRALAQRSSGRPEGLGTSPAGWRSAPGVTEPGDLEPPPAMPAAGEPV